MKWYEDFIRCIEQHQMPCSYKEFFGVECPGCGMQRAIIALLKGNVLESIQTYPPLLPLIAMYVFLVLHLIFRFRKGAKILLYMFIVTVALIVGSFAWKMVNKL